MDDRLAQDGTGFTSAEIDELARIFPPGPSATMILRRAGFPLAAIPGATGMSGRQFWTLIGFELEDGIFDDGRLRILDVAYGMYRANAVFGRAVKTGAPSEPPTAPPTPRISRILVLGAATSEPDTSSMSGTSNARHRTPALRADVEAAAILRAAELGHLEVAVRPAATIGDLDAILAVRPHVLHLICHGDGKTLTLQNSLGESHRVPATHMADLLRAYQKHGGAELAGVVLNACHSGGVAELFTSAAKTVIAHAGPLDDTCAALFAERMYRLLRDVPTLAAAASLAAEALAADETGCFEIREGLVVR